MHITLSSKIFKNRKEHPLKMDKINVREMYYMMLFSIFKYFCYI